MFGKKKKNTQLGQKEEKKDDGIMVSTIPEAFYGGKDPNIYETHKRPEKEKKAAPAPIVPAPKEPVEAPVNAGAAPSGKKRLVLIIIIVVLLLLVSTGVILWVTFGGSSDEPAPTEPAPPAAVQPPPTVIPPPPPVEPPPVVTTTPTTTPEAPEPSEEIVFPRILLVDSADLDGDSLTDVEEEYYNTDSGTWDTDGDGFFDGQEIENLYSPTEPAPTLLIDAGIVGEYLNPTHQYRLYYPIEWNVASVDPQDDQVLITAATGDYVQIIRSEKRPAETFGDWFARVATGEQITDLITFENRFDVRGAYRQDRLAAYFEVDDAIYVLLYHPGTADSLPFRQTMVMMYQGFRPSTSFATLPEQPVLPPVTTPSTTTTESAATTTTSDTEETATTTTDVEEETADDQEEAPSTF